MDRSWRTGDGVAAIAVLVALALAAPVSAATRPAADHLDRGFGEGGSAIVPVGLARGESPADETSVFSAAAPGGGTVFALNGPNTRKIEVVRLDRGGRPEPGFGHGGRVVVSLAGRGEVGVGGVAVDASGRILVAADNFLAPEPRAAVVALQPDGKLDPSFGDRGLAEPDLQIPPESQEADFGPPSVLPTGIAVDASGRIVLSGDVQREEGRCNTSQGVIARLEPSGALDPSFGAGGRYLFTNRSLPDAEGIAVGTDGSLTTWGPPLICSENRRQSQVLRLTEAGLPDPSFGTAGVFATKKLPREGRLFAGYTQVALAADGDTVYVRGDGTVSRLLPDGRPDPGFGKGGSVKLGIGPVRSGQSEDTISAVAVAPDGSVLVAGTRSHWITDIGHPLYRIFLASLTATGKPRPGFGSGGIVALPDSRTLDTVADQVYPVGDHAALVAGAVDGSPAPAGGGVVLYRFRLG